MRLSIVFTSVFVLSGVCAFAGPGKSSGAGGNAAMRGRPGMGGATATLGGGPVEDTIVTERHFTKQQLEEDVTYLTGVIERVHPDMFHSIDRKRYRRLTDSVRAVLHEGMSGREAWAALARLVGALDEGHSSFDFPEGLIDHIREGAVPSFPVRISEFNGHALVVRADGSTENKLLPGDQIVSINGISASRLIDTLSGYAGGLKTFRAIDVCRNMITCFYLYHIRSPYRIRYMRDGKPGSTELTAIPWPVLHEHMEARTKNLPPLPELFGYSFTDTARGFAYLAVNALTEKPERFGRFLDSCFGVLKARPVGKLIIDLRRNGGGNSVLGEALLGYITDKPFRMSGEERWKVSAEYKAQLDKTLAGKEREQMAYYFNAANGIILPSDGGQPAPPADHPLLYKGKVFVLIGPNTFSSANMLANVIQDYGLATLVGEPSGEPANDYGELIFLKLPNTGFRFSTSTKQFVRANGDRKDTHPVLPKYTITDNPTTPQDEVIEFTKRL